MPRAIRFWKVNCMEDRYPGLWHSWYLRQVAAVGWPPRWGYSLNGKPPKNSTGTSRGTASPT